MPPRARKEDLIKGVTVPLDFHDLGGHVLSRCCLGLSKPQPPRAQSLGQAAAFVGPGSLTNEDQVEGRVSWGEAKLGKFLNEVTWNHSKYVFFLWFWGIVGQFSGAHVLDYPQVVHDMPQKLHFSPLPRCRHRQPIKRLDAKFRHFKIWHWKSTTTANVSEIRRSPVDIFESPMVHRIWYLTGAAGLLNHQQFYWMISLTKNKAAISFPYASPVPPHISGGYHCRSGVPSLDVPYILFLEIPET